MRYILSVTILALAISAWNLIPSEPSVKDSGQCQSVNEFYDLVLAKHVFSLNGEVKSRQDLYNKAFDVLMYELDPLKVVFSSQQVEDLKGIDWIEEALSIKPVRGCKSFYNVIGQFQKSMMLLEKKFLSITPEVILSKVKNNETLKAFMEKVEQRDGWASSPAEHTDNIVWAVLTGFEEVRTHVETDKEAVDVALRMFSRQILTNTIENSTHAQEEIIRSLVHVLDAHSQFFSEQQMRDVFQSLTSSFVGVGIVVAEVGNGFKVTEVVEDGPADIQNALLEGDVISSINGITVAGVSTRVLADLLSGPRHTKVNMDIIRKVNSKRIIKRVAISRDHVKTKASEMEKDIISLNNRKLGYIHISHFYSGNSNSPGVSEDVAKIISGFNDESIDGLIIDLRGNGGGVLREVVDIAGLFLKSAPIVVEVGTVGDGVQVHTDRDGLMLYDGPLVVLVDQMSASASEILAGSLQNYNRAMIVGSPQTYGKGTIQEIGPINAMVKNPTKLEGGLKLTIGYYYLPNGESVQFEGVKSDVVVDDLLNNKYDSQQERSLPFALKRPEKIQTNFEALNLWINEKSFDNMVKFTTAQLRARTLVPKLSNTSNAKDKVKVKALQVLSDSITFQRSNFNPALASRLSK